MLRNQKAHAVTAQPSEWGALEFDPATITQIELGVPDQGAKIARDPERLDEWTGTWTTIAGDRTWGVSSNRVRGALRALSTTRVRLSNEQLVESGTPIALTARDGSSLVISVSPDRSGGRAPVRVEQRDESGAISRVLDGWVDSATVDAFQAPLTLAWRDEHLIRVPLPSVRSLSVSAGRHETELTLDGPRWMVTGPFTLPADREQAETLARTLINMQATEFIDAPLDDSTTGLGSPIAQITMRTGNDTFSIELGQQADLSAETLYARFTRAEQSTLIRVPIASLSKLTAYPDAYISPVANPIAQTDISAVRVLGLGGDPRFESLREQGQWVSQGEPVDTLNADAIRRLLNLLTLTRANAIRVLSEDTQLPRRIAGVTLLDRDGNDLGNYSVGMEESEQGIRLLVLQTLETGQQVVWAYLGEEAQATATWLTLSAGRPIPQG